MVSPWLHAADLVDPPDRSTWIAQPKQQLASELAGQADELLFGGAAGGGKTEWLIEYAARQMERHPGNRGVIFRRVFPSLNRSVIPRAQAKLVGRAVYNRVEHAFRFPNGSILELAHLQHEWSVHDYQGAEYGLVCWEEVTEFSEDQYLYLLSRTRAPAPGIRPHVIATANPGGRGHAWAKRRWVKPHPEDLASGQPTPKPGEVWQPAPSTVEPSPGRRVFVPATLDDNPALLERDPGYRSRLAAIRNTAVRRALTVGDWDAIDQIEGALWSWSVIDAHRVSEAPPLHQVVVSIDPAGSAGPDSDDTGILVVGRGVDGHGYVLADQTCHLPAAGWARRAWAAFDEWEADRFVAETNFGGDMVENTIRSVYEDRRAPVTVVNASRGKLVRAEPAAALYDHRPEDGAVCRVHHVGEFPELETQMTAWDPASGESPDRMDALVWALTHLFVLHPGGPGMSAAGQIMRHRVPTGREGRR